jgi:hypothetical protein
VNRSRGGSIMAKWCLFHHKENFYTPILKIFAKSWSNMMLLSLVMVCVQVLRCQWCCTIRTRNSRWIV